MPALEVVKYAFGGVIAFFGLLCLGWSLTQKKSEFGSKEHEYLERTFTQASIWLIGGLLIIFI
jgi:hypothetical protein